MRKVNKWEEMKRVTHNAKRREREREMEGLDRTIVLTAVPLNHDPLKNRGKETGIDGRQTEGQTEG